MRVFFAHVGATAPKVLDGQTDKLREVLADEFPGTKILVVTGLRDYKSHWRGNWDSWQKDVLARRDAVTGERLYQLFVVLGSRCGRATAGILKEALMCDDVTALRWDGEEELRRVESVIITDPEDWTSGHKVVCVPEQLELFDEPTTSA